MSRNYDNWERLVRAVRRREKDRHLASCASFSSLSSVDVSSRPSFADPAALSSQSISVSGKITAIGLEEIKLATQNFHPDTLLGEGRFGPIFKGWIHENLLTAVKPGSGIAVAIRKLNNGETFYLYLPRHPNLVKLIGYSSEEGNKLLVYEFVPNGSLDNHLFTSGHQLLSWETRVKVGIGAARGLSFCHDFGIIVTHKGLKSSSILLDDVFSANLSKFDLTTTRPSHLELNDYAAPECRATGFPTIESDVYSFGILLLELFSGLRVCDKNRPAEHENLVVWAKPYLRNKKKLLQIVDSRFEGQFPRDEAYKIWKLAFQCLSLNPKRRPRMIDVVDTLERLSSPLSDGPLYRRNPAELVTGIDRQMALAGWINSSFLDQDFVLAFGRDRKSFSVRRAVPLKFKEIQKATANFRPDLLLEEGSSVFKGVIHDIRSIPQALKSIILVVKKFNKEELVQHQECLAEINYWRQLWHPKLVNLIGYCFEADNRILVYEFVSCGSLSNHLSIRGLQLSWRIRLKVAIDVAEALLFLHSHMRYLHGGFDSGDILLDGVYNAKLSYCCLPRVASARSSQLAYEPPEYLSTGQQSAKSDVYRFGVVLLELLTGRRAYDINRPTDQQNLVQWAMPYLESKKLRIMDSRLDGQYSDDEANEVVKLALKCLSIDPGSRPTVADVRKGLVLITDPVNNLEK